MAAAAHLFKVRTGKVYTQTAHIFQRGHDLCLSEGVIAVVPSHTVENGKSRSTGGTSQDHIARGVHVKMPLEENVQQQRHTHTHNSCLLSHRPVDFVHGHKSRAEFLSDVWMIKSNAQCTNGQSTTT